MGERNERLSFLAPAEDVKRLDELVEKGVFSNRSDGMRELLAVGVRLLEAAIASEKDEDAAIDEGLEKVRGRLKLLVLKARIQEE